MRTLILAGLLALAGCTTAPVTMRNPHTGQTATCGPYYIDGAFSDAQAQRERACISDYQRQGFERAP